MSVSVNIFSINSYDDSQEKVYSFLNYFLENNLDISITYYCVKNLTEINDQYIDSIDKNKNYIERKGFYLYDNKISEYD